MIDFVNPIWTEHETRAKAVLIYTEMCLYCWECVIQKKSFSCAKNELWNIAKTPLCWGNQSIDSYSGGFLLKICFCSGQYMISCSMNNFPCSHEVGDLGEKIMHIPNLWQSICSLRNSWPWTYDYVAKILSTVPYKLVFGVCVHPIARLVLINKLLNMSI